MITHSLSERDDDIADGRTNRRMRPADFAREKAAANVLGAADLRLTKLGRGLYMICDADDIVADNWRLDEIEEVLLRLMPVGDAVAVLRRAQQHRGRNAGFYVRAGAQ